jgi:lysophospholipase L1-like esterase
VRRLPALLLTGLLAAPASACKADPGSADDGITHYVALGDSYTAAPGVPVTDPDDPCFRSDHNYPRLLADQLPRTFLTDVSCSGATTAAMTAAQLDDPGVAPQFDALSDDTDLVTIGVGGNDENLFLDWFTQCTQLAPSDPDGSPCADSNATIGGDVLLDRVPQIRENVEAVLEEAEEHAPNARILVVTYPRVFPERGTCRLAAAFATGDLAYINSIVKALSDALVAAAEAADVEHVDVYRASRGHDVCADEPWVNGDFGDQSRANWLHPFVEEQAAVAQLIREKL